MRPTARAWILRGALALLALAAAPAMAQDAPPATLDALLARFRDAPGFEARFVEEKRIAMLRRPVRSEGRIYFAPPGRMMRRVERPDPSAALIANGQLTMQQGGQITQIPIDDQPVLRGFIDSFRAVLAGDREALARFYHAEYTPDVQSGEWRLTLRPRAGALAEFLREIHLRGRGVAITDMRMIEASGDETHTTFSEVDVARRFTDAEARTIFRIP